MMVFNKKTLDKMGAYGSAFGALFPLFLWIITPTVILIPGIHIILSYIFNTCTHRRHIIFSWGAFGGALGALLGTVIVSVLSFFASFVFFAQRHSVMPLLEHRSFIYCTIYMIIPIFAFLFSRYFCKRAQKKEELRKAGKSKWP